MATRRVLASLGARVRAVPETHHPPSLAPSNTVSISTPSMRDMRLYLLTFRSFARFFSHATSQYKPSKSAPRTRSPATTRVPRAPSPSRGGAPRPNRYAQAPIPPHKQNRRLKDDLYIVYLLGRYAKQGSPPPTFDKSRTHTSTSTSTMRPIAHLLTPHGSIDPARLTPI